METKLTKEEKEKLISNIINNKELDDIIENGARVLFDINLTAKNEINDIKKEYLYYLIYMFASSDDAKRIFGKGKLDEDLKEKVKNCRSTYSDVNKILNVDSEKIIYGEDSDNKSEETGCYNDKDNKVEIPITDNFKEEIKKISFILKLFAYIGIDDILNIFEENGIEISISKTFEEENSFYKDESIKTKILGLVKEMSYNKNFVAERRNKLRNDLFCSIDSSIRFSSENKYGIKFSNFNKLVKSKYTHLRYDEERFKKFQEKLVENTEDNIIREEISLEKNKTI